MVNEAELKKLVDERKKEAELIIDKGHLIRKVLGKGILDNNYSEGGLSFDFFRNYRISRQGSRIRWGNITVFQAQEDQDSSYVTAYYPNKEWLMVLEKIYEKAKQAQTEKRLASLIDQAKKLGITQ